MEDGRTQDNQDRLLAELRAIREQLSRLEERVDVIAGARPAPDARLRTHVDGLDEALDGGIPCGHVVFLAGPGGSMKTSLALYIMQRNRSQGAHGLYFTLEESRESLLKTMGRLGIGRDEDFIVDIGKLRLEHEAAESTKDWLQILKDYLSRRLEKNKLDLVVVDPFNSLYSLAGIVNPRRELFHFFAFLRGTGVTSILISETEMNAQALPNQEDFLADGVLMVNFTEDATGEPGLRLRCLKMRHSNHSRLPLRLVFEGGNFSAKEPTRP